MQNFLFIWLGMSILMFLLAQAGLWLFLRRRQVSIKHFFVGTPGYLDARYIQWCRGNDRSYFTVIILRVLLLANIIFVTVLIQNFVPPLN